MFNLLAQVARFFFSNEDVRPSPAAILLEDAGNWGGHDAYHAQELRSAASAWLRVVR